MRDCFVCLDKTKNKVCLSCECYAHPKCFGKYVRSISHITVFHIGNFIALSAPLFSECPQCRRNTGTVKPLTRSDTKPGRVYTFNETIKDFVNIIKHSTTILEKEIYIQELLKYIYNNKNLLTKSHKKILRKCIKNFYYRNGWKKASMYYRLIFNKHIQES